MLIGACGGDGAQTHHNRVCVEILKQPNRRHAGGPRLFALSGIVERYATERQHGHGRVSRMRTKTDLAQQFKAIRVCRAGFFEYRRNQDEISAVRLRPRDFFRRVCGRADDAIVHPRPIQNDACFAGGKIVRRKMHAVRARSQSDINPRVDQQLCRGSCGEGMPGFYRELLQFTRREVFFAQLDVIHARRGTFRDLGQ